MGDYRDVGLEVLRENLESLWQQANTIEVECEAQGLKHSGSVMREVMGKITIARRFVDLAIHDKRKAES